MQRSGEEKARRECAAPVYTSVVWATCKNTWRFGKAIVHFSKQRQRKRNQLRNRQSNFTHHPSHTKDESHKELKHTLEFLIRENELKWTWGREVNTSALILTQAQSLKQTHVSPLRAISYLSFCSRSESARRPQFVFPHWELLYFKW